MEFQKMLLANMKENDSTASDLFMEMLKKECTASDVYKTMMYEKLDAIRSHLQELHVNAKNLLKSWNRNTPEFFFAENFNIASETIMNLTYDLEIAISKIGHVEEKKRKRQK